MHDKKNILIVLADQLNAEWLGCAGHPQALTPNLDAFARTGVRFERAYCQNPICTPSRVSLLSGQYCHNHGYFGLSGPAPFGLNHLLRHAKASGYRTAAYGKLHLPESPRNWIADDVDEFGDCYETADGVIGDSEFFRGLKRKGLRKLEDSWHNRDCYGEGSIPIDAMPSLLPFEETMEMWCADRAIRFMEEGGNAPFCIQVAFQKPHHPLLPNRKFWDLYPEDLALPERFAQKPDGRPPQFRRKWEEWRAYRGEFGTEGEPHGDFVRRCWRGTLACVSQIDWVFGRLLDFLKRSGLEENTVVVFGSDHGAYHGLYGLLEKAPGICSEAVCRVPMIWRVPGVTEPGSVSRAFVENVDLAPTLAAVCGGEPFETADGANLLPLLGGRVAGVREMAVTENVWSKAIRWKNWRFVHYQSDAFAPEEADAGELYDLEKDPGETANLYHDPAFAPVVTTCRRLLLEWLIRTRRTVTTQVSVKALRESQPPVGQAFRYPLCTDGRAPSLIQKHRRADLNEMYL